MLHSVMMYVDEQCPVCNDNADSSQLLLNRHDFFECPTCRVQISFAAIPVATVLPMKGNGNFRDKSEYVPAKFIDALLAGSQKSIVVQADLNLIFRDRDELLAYINQNA